MTIIAIMNQSQTKAPLRDSTIATARSERLSEQLKAEAELLRGLGMTQSGFERWQRARSAALAHSIASTSILSVFGVMSKTFRMLLQSAMLGLGALLVLRGEMTAGAMVAASILMGRAWPRSRWRWGNGRWCSARAKAGHVWPNFCRACLTSVRALPSRVRVRSSRSRTSPSSRRAKPPHPADGQLQPRAGKALGVIGQSGSGKTTLAKALIGIWRPASGKIRLDGASLDQYDPDVLGSYFGYLPQRVTLFDGTIAENIARLHVQPDPEKVVAAAKKAAAHDMIVRLPEGYDTRVSAIGGRLSGGQIQRVGLARAMYGDPLILVLDEPNSNLDNDGTVALNLAIRAMKAEGKSVLIMAHRPNAIQECDLLLVLDEGTRQAFGPRDQVLREIVKNHTEIIKTTAPGGVA